MILLLFGCASFFIGFPLTAILAFIVLRAVVSKECTSTTDYSYVIPWVVLLVICWSAVALVVFNAEYDGLLG